MQSHRPPVEKHAGLSGDRIGYSEPGQRWEQAAHACCSDRHNHLAAQVPGRTAVRSVAVVSAGGQHLAALGRNDGRRRKCQGNLCLRHADRLGFSRVPVNLVAQGGPCSVLCRILQAESQRKNDGIADDGVEHREHEEKHDGELDCIRAALRVDVAAVREALHDGSACRQFRGAAYCVPVLLEAFFIDDVKRSGMGYSKLFR